MLYAKLVPELICCDMDRSLSYTDVLELEVMYAGPEERFAYLNRDGLTLMSEQQVARAWTTPSRMNLQIEIGASTRFTRKSRQLGASMYVPLEGAWYRAGDGSLGSRQFIVLDPDGYLSRFAGNLGEVRSDE